MANSTKNSKNYLIVIGIIIGFAIILIGKQLLTEKPTFDKVMTEMASEFNKALPMMIDKETRLDNTMAMPDNSFIYNYTLVNLPLDSIDVTYFNEFMEPIIINNVKSNPDLIVFRDNDVTLQYSYKDMYGVFISKIIVAKEDYR